MIARVRKKNGRAKEAVSVRQSTQAYTCRSMSETTKPTALLRERRVDRNGMLLLSSLKKVDVRRAYFLFLTRRQKYGRYDHFDKSA